MILLEADTPVGCGVMAFQWVQSFGAVTRYEYCTLVLLIIYLPLDSCLHLPFYHTSWYNKYWFIYRAFTATHHMSSRDKSERHYIA